MIKTARTVAQSENHEGQEQSWKENSDHMNINSDLTDSTLN